MRQIKNLIRKDFLTSFIFRIPHMIKDKKERKKLLIYPILFLIFGSYIYLAGKYVLSWIDIYDSMGLGNVFILQAFFAYTFLLLFSAVPMTISNFYYSNDVSILLPLPIKKSDILFSKMLYNSITLMTTSLFLVVPIVFKYGIFYGKSILYYLAMIIITVAYTTLVIAIVTLLVVLLMSAINRYARAKNILQVIGTILILFLSFGFSYLINKGMDGGSGSSLDIANIIAKSMKNLVNYLPMLKPIEWFLNGNALGVLVLVISAVLLTYIVSRLLGGLLTKGILSNQVVTKRKKISPKQKEKIYKPRTQMQEIFRKDIMSIFKTPIYLLNTFSMAFIMPVALIIPFVAQRETIGIGLSDARLFISAIPNIFPNEKVIAISLLVSIIVSFFIGMGGMMVAATSITREGKNIWLMQTLPISPKNQVLGRILSGGFAGVVSILPITILIFAVFTPPLIIAIPFIISVIATSFFAPTVGLYRDISKPKLDWDTPQKAMKSNLNIVMLTYAFMILAGLVGAAIYLLLVSSLTDLQIMLVSIGILLLILILTFVVYARSIEQLKKKLSSYSV